MGFELRTKRDYDFGEVTSAMQKAIRRNDARIAGYFAIELFESGYQEYAWKRMLTISAEDCAGIITQEIQALFQAWLLANGGKKGEKGRIFLAKAAILLCQWPKSRDADHLTNLIYDRSSQITGESIETLLTECRGEKIEIPEYAYDCHTKRGKQRGRTKAQFFHEEQAALQPRLAGLFDEDLNKAKI